MSDNNSVTNPTPTTTTTKRHTRRKRRHHKNRTADDDSLSGALVIDESRNVVNFERDSKPDVSKFVYFDAEVSFIDLLQEDQYIIRDRNLGLTEYTHNVSFFYFVVYLRNKTLLTHEIIDIGIMKRMIYFQRVSLDVVGQRLCFLSDELARGGGAR
jgi:hypothetical protein